jgi:hypothetical protein
MRACPEAGAKLWNMKISALFRGKNRPQAIEI